MQLSLRGASGKKVQILAASLGGGSFELQKVDGFRVKMKGDYYALFVWANKNITQELQDLISKGVRLHTNKNSATFLYMLESATPF